MEALQPSETMQLFTNLHAVTFQTNEYSAASLLKPQSCKPLVAWTVISYWTHIKHNTERANVLFKATASLFPQNGQN